MSNLVLISCSDKKKEGGVKLRPGKDFKPWIQNTNLLQNLYETRIKVFQLIKSNKLRDTEKRQGIRGDDPRNHNLVEGPDFGSTNQEGHYLPACLRYTGRFFRTIRGTSSEEDTYDIWQKGNTLPFKTLILSGLYGVLSPFDYIQEYSCHFSDRIVGTDQSLKQMWKPVLTQIALELKRNDPELNIVDLLSEETYQSALDWAKIYKHNAKCFHRAYKLKAGPETLLNSARFYKNEILNNNSDLSLKSDVFISKEYFDDQKEKILFEPELFSSLRDIVREGVNEVEPDLKMFYGSTWNILDKKVKHQIANSESIYIKNKDLRGYDFTGSAIFLNKAIEIWLHQAVLIPLQNIPGIVKLLKYDRDHYIQPEKATLGNISHLLKGICRYRQIDPFILTSALNIFPNTSPSLFIDLANEITYIADNFRNGWVHRKPMPRDKFEEFRVRAKDFFNIYTTTFKALS